jgi:organic radical activating enzyme
MKINAIYHSFNGEQCPMGIGSPTIIVRVQGCPVRCYQKTFGVLCDTPEALEINAPNKERSIESIIEELSSIKQKTGIKNLLLTGGDPMYHKEFPDFIKEVAPMFTNVTVESAGVVEFYHFPRYHNVHYIIDYKLSSAGLSTSASIFNRVGFNQIYHLRNTDYLKFVVADIDDFNEMVYAVKRAYPKSSCKFVAGVYYGGKNMELFEMYNLLATRGMLGQISINLQAHKLVQTETFSRLSGASNAPINPLT